MATVDLDGDTAGRVQSLNDSASTVPVSDLPVNGFDRVRQTGSAMLTPAVGPVT